MSLNPKATSLQRISEALMLIYFFFLPLWQEASIIAIILLSVLIVISGIIKDSLQFIMRDSVTKLFIAWYLLHVAGLVYSSDLVYGFDDIQTKLSFLVIPLVFCGLNFGKDSYARIRKVFIYACAFSLVILISISFKNYLSSHEVSEFFYTSLSHGKHATYITLYFNLAILFIQQIYFEKKKEGNSYNLFLIFIFLFTGILLLSSRTATIVSIISLFVFPVLAYRSELKHAGRRTIYLSSMGFMLILFCVFLNLNNRFLQVRNEIEKKEIPGRLTIPENPNSTNIRLNLWKNAIELIGRHPFFGVGTGDIKEELVKIYTENGYEYGAQYRFSPHNQFLHTGVILGISGIILLLCGFAFSAAAAIKKNDWLYFIFLIVVFLNCMTESLLERQAGILFFTAFNTFFYLRSSKTSS